MRMRMYCQDQAVRGGQRRRKVSIKVKVSEPKEAQRLSIQVSKKTLTYMKMWNT